MLLPLATLMYRGLSLMQCIRPAQQNDFNRWCELYNQYLKFYKTELSREQLMIVWSWFFQEERKIYCFVSVSGEKITGFVHFREFLRPIKASAGLFMDDLFVDPAQRGEGIGQELIKSVEEFASERNIAVIRWITGADNENAMKVYDKLANKTSWVMYDMIVNAL